MKTIYLSDKLIDAAKLYSRGGEIGNITASFARLLCKVTPFEERAYQRLFDTCNLDNELDLISVSYAEYREYHTLAMLFAAEYFKENM